jgi:hypothetical protein
MKKFIIKLAWFILPIFIIAFPLDYAISHLLKKTAAYQGELEVWRDIYSTKAKCEIAIYGSSRAWVHVSPTIISDTLQQDAYNFGMDGHNFWLQYLRHIELLKHNKKPKTIILSLDIFSLQKRTDLYQMEQFLPIMYLNDSIRKYTSSYTGFSSADYYLPLVRYAGKGVVLKKSLQILLGNEPITRYRTKGYAGIEKQWTTDYEKARNMLQSYAIKFDNKTIELLERFIIECRTNNIELVLLYTPEYVEGQKFVTNKKQLMGIFEGLAKRYALDFYDYSSDSICLDKSLFYNVTHLNKAGSEVFTRKFASDLKHRRLPH